MSFSAYEESIDMGSPVECFLFSYYDQVYSYTSSQESQTINIDGNLTVFNAEYIKRGDSLRTGNSAGNQEACTITVLRNNPIALLYQGAPPEQDSVRVTVYRKHGSDSDEYIIILCGYICQAEFNGTLVDLTVVVEDVLNTNIPRGVLSYYCQNCLFDNKCGLDESSYARYCVVKDYDGLKIHTDNLRDVSVGYYDGGFIKIGNTYRQVKNQFDDYIIIKYPLSKQDKVDSFIIYPGCDGLFKTCATKFHNTDNFTGVPYIQPYNVFKNPAYKGVYWVRSDLIWRDTEGQINEG